ncbi:MAG: thioredoxin domain-containing protein [Sandaracinaceae bacterium]|nr:thioredoxin domain-containing protein [Sandaracinaceae bacterium]
MPSRNLPQVSEQNFEEEVLRSSVPVIVDFTGKYCAPCRQIEPILEELSREFADRLKVVQLDVEEGPQVAAKAGVRAIPTLIIYKNGSPIATHKGAAPKPILKRFFEQALV